MNLVGPQIREIWLQSLGQTHHTFLISTASVRTGASMNHGIVVNENQNETYENDELTGAASQCCHLDDKLEKGARSTSRAVRRSFKWFSHFADRV